MDVCEAVCEGVCMCVYVCVCVCMCVVQLQEIGFAKDLLSRHIIVDPLSGPK